MNFLSLDSPISDLYMVGSSFAKRLTNLEIFTINDLVHHYPVRYEDFRLICNIDSLQLEEIVTIKATVLFFKNIFSRLGKKIQEVIVSDQSGTMKIIFFNQTFLESTLRPGTLANFSGKVASFNNKTALISPEFEICKNEPIHTARLVPVYPETYGISSKWLRSRIYPLIFKTSLSIPDFLPQKIIGEQNLINLAAALQKIHFPQNNEDISEARQRLAFDELFLLQINALIQKNNWLKQKVTKSLKIDNQKINSFIKKLPFELTEDQNKVLEEILADIKKTTPMNRLLQGDVGCGKTIVSAICSYVAFLNKAQSVLMAPTEILAQQHYETFNKFLSPLGVRIGLVTSAKKINHKQNFDILIGTHALIQSTVKFENLGLVIIDEQHRFGVGQRATLINKGKCPHVLIMTATPIPRTVSLTLYGDLDMSVINQMPQGRQKVKTWVVDLNKRDRAYQWIKKKLTGRNQAFIVCPLIDQSESESLKDIRAAKDEFLVLSKKVFPEFKLGLLHGRLKAKDKDEIIIKFKKHQINILVSTPVVEVGIDIPNAIIIVIEAAERFGLASLHQLRGRVGRSDKESYCLLFSSKSEVSQTRLKLMENYSNGLKLAEMDLNLRGPGQIYGKIQHGYLGLKIASFSDINLIEKTRKVALSLLESVDFKLNQLPHLRNILKKYTIDEIQPN